MERMVQHRREKEGSPQELNLLAPSLKTSSPQDCAKINVCCLSHPVAVDMLWQPELTKTTGFKSQDVDISLGATLQSTATGITRRSLVTFLLPRARIKS